MFELSKLPKGFSWGEAISINHVSGFYPLYYTPELNAPDGNGKTIVVACEPELLGYFPRKDADKYLDLLESIQPSLLKNLG